MHWVPNFNPSTYNKDQIQWIERFIKFIDVACNSNIWIDIGANKGDISTVMVENAKATDKIWLFEPAPATYDLLCERFKECSNVEIWNTALSNYNGTNDFYIEEQDTTSGFNFLEKSFFGLDTNKYVKTTCKVRQLDSIVIPESYQIPFIKIDAEGHDFNILKGASAILSKYRPYVLFEFSGMLGSNTFDFSPRDMYDFFKMHNYTVKSMIGGHDEKYIYKHYKINTPELSDLLAVPIEKPID